MLVAGRIDVVISKRHVATPLLRTRFTSAQRARIASIPVSQKTTPVYDYLLISKQSEHAEYYLDAFNRGLRKLQDSGEYQQLIDGLLHGEYVN